MAQQSVRNFVILRRFANNAVTQCELNTNEFTYAASAANLALDFMCTDAVRRTLAHLAIDIENHRQGDWPQWYQPFHNNLERAVVFITRFLQLVRAEFPMVIIDEKIDNPNIFAAHPRGAWNGQFRPREQAVCINARVPSRCSWHPAR